MTRIIKSDPPSPLEKKMNKKKSSQWDSNLKNDRGLEILLATTWAN